MAQWIKANGEIIDVEPKNGKDFGLDELQSFVGGYIEIVETSDFRLIVVDEEGKLKRKLYNHYATMMYGKQNDVIVGDVLVCEPNQIK